MSQSIRAAVQWAVGEKWSPEQVELHDPREDEVLVEVRACGLCHSDDHNVTGDFPSAVPVVGGHEAAGVVQAVGTRVTRVAVGDRVIVYPIPACGKCAWCSAGRGYLCDMNAWVMSGHAPDGHFRFSKDGTGIGSYSQVGGFAEKTVVSENHVIKIDEDIPFEVAALVACGFTTGYGSAVNVADVRPGDTVVVVGVGGVGTGAVQGAEVAGAATIVAVDPKDTRRKAILDFGAHDSAQDIDSAVAIVASATNNVMADAVIVTAGVVTGELIGAATKLVGKGGKLIVTGVPPYYETAIPMPVSEYIMYNRSIGGNVWGGTQALWDIPRILRLYKRGRLKLDQMITQTYSLDQINDGYADMHAGKNTRGVLVF
jgi:S-(hydroxymethyl)glutathione dehydrogenase/alcohol dehydrogenase